MTKALAVLVTMLLAAIARVGYAEETSQPLLQTKVTGRFPTCQFSAPNVQDGTPGIADRGFVFLPAEVEVGGEGVFASWYTVDSNNVVNFVAGIWPLSAVTILQNSPRNFSLQFIGDVNNGYQKILLKLGNPSKLEVRCTRAPTRAPDFSIYQSTVQRGSLTTENFFPLGSPFPPFGPFFDDIKSVNGGYTLTSAFIDGPVGTPGGTINGVTPIDPPFFPKLVGFLETYSGQYTRIIQIITRSPPAAKGQ